MRITCQLSRQTEDNLLTHSRSKILSKIFISTRKHKMLESSHLLCMSSLILWLLIFSLQPHKEERFMYPVYPLICATAAFTIKLIEQFVVGTRKPYSLPVFKSIVVFCCLTFFCLSLSRVISVRNGKFFVQQAYPTPNSK